MRKISSVIITVMMLLSTFVLAQTEGLADPGMTPDNPLYFLDEVSDLFQAEETVNDEKAKQVAAETLQKVLAESPEAAQDLFVRFQQLLVFLFLHSMLLIP